MTITRMVKDFVVMRRRQDTYAVKTHCPILDVLSDSYDFTMHGFSTMILFHAFSNHMIMRSLDKEEYSVLKSFVETGSPVVRSINDGQQHNTNARFVYPRGASRPHTPLKVTVSEDCLRTNDDVKTPEKAQPLDESETSTISTTSPTPEAPEMQETQESTETEHETQPVEPMYSALHMKSKKGPAKRCDWSVEEDWRLVRGFREYEGKWRAMARGLQLGSDDRLRNRWFRLVEGSQSADPEVVKEAQRLAKEFESVSVPPKKKRKITLSFQGRTYTAPSSSSSSECGDDSDRKQWTPAEDALIIDAINRPSSWENNADKKRSAPWTYLTEKLPGRTKQAIRNRAHRLVMRNTTRAALEWKEPEFLT